MKSEITQPTLFLDHDICKANIKQMAEKAGDHNLVFKPHMKTHQSAEIGEWLREAGATAATVSSVKMAQYFVQSGWSDITIAFPAHPQQLKGINELADKVEITLLINSIDTAKFFDGQLEHPVKAYIEIDTGSDRTGFRADQQNEIADLISALNSSQKLEWIGFYSHPGHSYQCRSKQEIIDLHQNVIDQFKKLRADFSDKSNRFEICVGDTPCCSAGENFNGIDAISPGNFVFYDLMQAQIGSCAISDIAVAVECPIVDLYSHRNELAIHGGAIHFSKEHQEQNHIYHYGLAAHRKNGHWQLMNPKAYLTALSQEHGMVKSTAKMITNCQVGDTITILPVHSCLTANLMKQYSDDKSSVIQQWG